MMICLPPQGTPPPPTQQPTWPTAYTAHSQHCGHIALPTGQKTNRICSISSSTSDPCTARTVRTAGGACRFECICSSSKGFALTWYRALTWYSSPARPFAAPDDPRLVTGQQGSPSPACQQLSRARNVCAGGSSEGSTELKHGIKLERTLASSSTSDSCNVRTARTAGDACRFVSIKGPHRSTDGQGEADPSTATGGSKPCVTK